MCVGFLTDIRHGTGAVDVTVSGRPGGGGRRVKQRRISPVVHTWLHTAHCDKMSQYQDVLEEEGVASNNDVAHP